jgi:pimeloyl-ACP methyl ester carboxylesterase
MLPNTQVMRLRDGRQVEFARLGAGGPLAVLEAGGGMRMTTWKKVLSETAAFTTAVAYNRAGFGKSSPAEAPRNGPSIVRELRTFLRELGLNPPYVLVGHSLDGLYMQLFARLHPDVVAGLVLVGPSHPFMDVLIDVDALAAKDGEDWVWRGGATLPPAHECAMAPGGPTISMVCPQVDEISCTLPSPPANSGPLAVR